MNHCYNYFWGCSIIMTWFDLSQASLMENKLLFIRPELTWFNKLGTAQPLALSHSSAFQKIPIIHGSSRNTLQRTKIVIIIIKDAIGVSLFSAAWGSFLLCSPSQTSCCWLCPGWSSKQVTFRRVSKGFSKKLCPSRVCLSAKRTTMCLFSWTGGKPLKVMESLNHWWARQPASVSREVYAQGPTRAAAAIPGLQQSSKPGSSDLWHFIRDFGNLCNFQSGTQQRRDKHQQKLGTLVIALVFN